MYSVVSLVGFLLRDANITARIVAQVLVGSIVYVLMNYRFIRKELIDFEEHGNVWD